MFAFEVISCIKNVKVKHDCKRKNYPDIFFKCLYLTKIAYAPFVNLSIINVVFWGNCAFSSVFGVSCYHGFGYSPSLEYIFHKFLYYTNDAIIRPGSSITTKKETAPINCLF